MTPLSEVMQVLDSILEGKELFLFGLLTHRKRASENKAIIDFIVSSSKENIWRRRCIARS